MKESVNESKEVKEGLQKIISLNRGKEKWEREK